MLTCGLFSSWFLLWHWPFISFLYVFHILSLYVVNITLYTLLNMFTINHCGMPDLWRWLEKICMVELLGIYNNIIATIVIVILLGFWPDRGCGSRLKGSGIFCAPVFANRSFIIRPFIFKPNVKPLLLYYLLVSLTILLTVLCWVDMFVCLQCKRET